MQLLFGFTSPSVDNYSHQQISSLVTPGLFAKAGQALPGVSDVFRVKHLYVARCQNKNEL